MDLLKDFCMFLVTSSQAAFFEVDRMEEKHIMTLTATAPGHLV
jgi:hypothetical protein